MRVLILILVAGCGFRSTAARGDDADTGTEGSGTAARDIPHVPTAFELLGMSELVLANGTMIDTTTLAIGPGAIPDAMIDPVGQEPGGPELMLIRARSVTIPPGAVVRATGSRPLVILADRIVIAGTLDAAGHLGKPGPNGGTLAAPSSMGTGGNGDHKDAYSDSGGGGGSYGTVAGIGGKGSVNGGGCSPATSGGSAGAPWGTTTDRTTSRSLRSSLARADERPQRAVDHARRTRQQSCSVEDPERALMVGDAPEIVGDLVSAAVRGHVSLRTCPGSHRGVDIGYLTVQVSRCVLADVPQHELVGRGSDHRPHGFASPASPRAPTASGGRGGDKETRHGSRCDLHRPRIPYGSCHRSSKTTLAGFSSNMRSPPILISSDG